MGSVAQPFPEAFCIHLESAYGKAQGLAWKQMHPVDYAALFDQVAAGQNQPITIYIPDRRLRLLDPLRYGGRGFTFGDERSFSPLLPSFLALPHGPGGALRWYRFYVTGGIIIKPLVLEGGATPPPD